MKLIRIRRSDFSIPISLETGEPNVIIVERPLAHVLDFEDTHFNFDRSVLLPDVARVDGSIPILDERRITGLGVVYATYIHAKRKPEHKVLVIGHADKAGSKRYNQKLSEKRAEGVFLLLSGERERWRKLADKECEPDDVQAVLRWQFEAMGWDCDPGELTGKMNKDTERAVGRFQLAYNDAVQAAQDQGLDLPYEGKIGVDEDIGPDTWGAVYDVYMLALMRLLKLDASADLKALQAKIQPFDDVGPSIGCGEHIPFSARHRQGFRSDEEFERPQRNPPDRRVEVLFFDAEEKPDLVCHAGGGCNPTDCPLYNTGAYVHRPIGVPKGLQIGEVNLRLGWEDPEGKVRPLPEGTQVTISFTLGDRIKRTLVGGGRIQFVAPRNNDEFIFSIELGEDNYLVLSTDEDGKEVSEFLSRADAMAKFDSGARFFRVPDKLGSADAQWAAPKAIGFEFGMFVDFKNRKTQIGSRAAPAAITLKPVWQHFRFDYFDRWDAQPRSVPQPRPRKEGTEPLVLQGFLEDGGIDNGPQGDPEAEAVWDVAVEGGALHCLPWVRKDWKRPLPDAKCLTRFATAKNTFVRAEDDDTRVLVTVPSGHALHDEVSKAGVARVRYYDLPVDWWANGYYVRFGGEKAAAKRKFDVTQRSSHDKPFVVDLDDIVLATKSQTISPFGDTRFEPVTGLVWDETDDNRFTLWSHELVAYQPDDTEPYFTNATKLAPKPDGPVILDHPPFTRLVTRAMKVFEAFGERSPRDPKYKDLPIGARLAVEPNEPNVNDAFVCYARKYSSRRVKTLTQDASIGTMPTMVLRCCGRDKDKEVFRFVQYAPVWFDYAPSSPARGTAITPTPTRAHQLAKISTCLTKAMKRWNGRDAKNLARAEYHVGPKDAVKARGLYHAILVRATSNTKHYTVQIVNGARAFMSEDVTAPSVWEENDLDTHTHDAFTAAHEFGHAFGNPDEYVERGRNASLWSDGIADTWRSPGAPYRFDKAGMMKANIRPRTHSYWHQALWMIDKDLFDGEKEIAVDHGLYRYAPKVTKLDKNRARFPVIAKTDQKVGTAGLVDVFAYHVGVDRFNADDHQIKGASLDDPFDFLIVVRVKTAWNLAETKHKDYDGGQRFFRKVTKTIRRLFNDKLPIAAEGNFDGKPVRARLLFSPRVISRTYPTGSSGARTQYLTQLKLTAVTGTAYRTKVSSLVTKHGIHAEFEAKKDPDERGIKPPYTTPRLGLVDTDKLEDDVIDVFGTLIGLDDPKTKDPNKFKPLFDLLAPKFTYTTVELAK